MLVYYSYASWHSLTSTPLRLSIKHRLYSEHHFAARLCLCGSAVRNSFETEKTCFGKALGYFRYGYFFMGMHCARQVEINFTCINVTLHHICISQFPHCSIKPFIDRLVARLQEMRGIGRYEFRINFIASVLLNPPCAIAGCVAVQCQQHGLISHDVLKVFADVHDKCLENFHLHGAIFSHF